MAKNEHTHTDCMLACILPRYCTEFAWILLEHVVPHDMIRNMMKCNNLICRSEARFGSSMALQKMRLDVLSSSSCFICCFVVFPDLSFSLSPF